MGDGVFFFFGTGAEIKVVLIFMENRVITKTIIPGDSVEDMTFADPLKIKGFAVAIFQEADATMIFGRAILRLFQQIQNMLIHYRIIPLGDFIGPSGGMKAREMLAQSFDFDP